MRNDQEQFQALGPKVDKPAEAPPGPQCQPTGTPNIERNHQGQLRNIAPTPPPAYPYFGNPTTWGTAI